jgi:hypothetical protein
MTVAPLAPTPADRATMKALLLDPTPAGSPNHDDSFATDIAKEFQLEQQHRLLCDTILEAEACLARGESEAAFDMFTQVLLWPPPAAAHGEAAHKRARARARVGLQRARAAINGGGSSVAPPGDGAGATSAEKPAADDAALTKAALVSRQFGRQLSVNVQPAEPRASQCLSPYLAKFHVMHSTRPAGPSKQLQRTSSTHAQTQKQRSLAAESVVEIEIDGIEQQPSLLHHHHRYGRKRVPKSSVESPAAGGVVELKDLSSHAVSSPAARGSPPSKWIAKPQLLQNVPSEVRVLESLRNGFAALDTMFLRTVCFSCEAKPASGECDVTHVHLRHYSTGCEVTDDGRSWHWHPHSALHFLIFSELCVPLPCGRGAVVIRTTDQNHGGASLLSSRQPSHHQPFVGHLTYSVRCHGQTAVGSSPDRGTIMTGGGRTMSCSVRSFCIDKLDDGHVAKFDIWTECRSRGDMSGSPKEQPAVEPTKAEATVVRRRFSDFQQLHALLASSLQGTVYAMPSLPPKTFVIRRFDIPFLVERRKRLEFYLQALLRIPTIPENPDLHAFLNTSPRGTSASGPV